MEKKFPSVNLLKNKQASFTDHFISWALTIGRVLVVVVELVALLAFLYRFSLDQQLIDLHGKIKEEQTIVNLLKENEEKYRNLQDRLDIASNFATLNVTQAKIFNDVVSFVPNGLTFNSLTVDNKIIRITATVGSVTSLSTFVDKLKNYSRVDSVSIDKIENKPANAVILVTLTANLKPEKNKYVTTQ